jgi:hypothetical protein
MSQEESLKITGMKIRTAKNGKAVTRAMQAHMEAFFPKSKNKTTEVDPTLIFNGGVI